MSIPSENPTDLAIKTLKALVMDAIEKSASGHPGMPMGMSTVATVLWTRFLKFDPSAPDWPDRDRFVLSAGHGSMLLYSLLHLSGVEDVTMEQIQQFRQWGSKTPGHPEVGETAGVETTTGPLGQGLGNAVGMAIAERLLAGRFNSDERRLVNHRTYVIASDGDLMEGVASEAASLAGHLGLGRLVVLYDDNKITIDGSTTLSFTEDVAARFEAYDWHVVRDVDGHDASAVERAIRAANTVSERPSLIQCLTHIGHGAPTKQDSETSHGAPLGPAEVAGAKRAMGWPDAPTFHIPEAVLALFSSAMERGRGAHAAWRTALENTDAATRTRFLAQLARDTPAAVLEALPTFEPGQQIATRKASGTVLNALVQRDPRLVGGSADLAESNGTHLKGFRAIQRDAFGADCRTFNFGVREHGMGALLNGLSLHGGFRPFGATFLIFSDYMRPSVRLAALMHQPVVYVFTHDSVFLGEDGPTHQPVEQAMSLRLIPNLYVVRPADATETAGAWRLALERSHGPTALLLTRQNLPVLATTSSEGVSRGGYVVRDTEGPPDVILMATGSEVSLAVAAAERLTVKARVVSLPCWERFFEQTADYRESVLPSRITARVAVEAGRSFGWERLIGDRGHCHGIDRFGASAPAGRIAKELGFTPEALVATVQRYLDAHR